MGYQRVMGYGFQITAYQLGGMGEYGLSGLWVKRESTVQYLRKHARHLRWQVCLIRACTFLSGLCELFPIEFEASNECQYRTRDGDNHIQTNVSIYHRTETFKSPMRRRNSTLGIFFDLNFRRPSSFKPEQRAKNAGVGAHTII